MKILSSVIAVALSFTLLSGNIFAQNTKPAAEPKAKVEKTTEVKSDKSKKCCDKSAKKTSSKSVKSTETKNK